MITGNGYLMERDEILRKYTGEWILLFNDEIVDHSINLEEMLKRADEQYPSDKFPEDNIKISKVLSGSVHLR
jgi:hypothetical protein